ncbi:hypothetical protein QBC34DRAFT_442389 [Podospora aff. communis PSN243]|uniref:GATA-type domain-containing protein n=1 Tax=Podospora aff. communis PSN243 TaxID=3040156 RepID=A0AAV9GB92_9PEZI|nr:hypothetical protein QBC34DRAFT_442389 [Podospora aff. communis PSN243]
MSVANNTQNLELNVVKEFPPFGNLQQYRLAKVTTFTCDRCTKQKTSKLVVTKDGDWETLLCNGCYGWLRSDKGKEK